MMDHRFDRRTFLGSVAVASAGSSAPPDQSSVSITDVGGIRVGHFTDKRKPTGCTAILFDRPAVTGVDVRGSAPGTRETDLLSPTNTVESVNAIVLAGGSAFGLDAATGVMRYLEENQQGYRVGSLVVPIVPAAILFDLNVGDARIRPDADAGYDACRVATAEHVQEGSVGAGAGATVGKLFGMKAAMKGGLGMASVQAGGSGLIVGAIVAVNAAGDIYDEHGTIMAGALTPDGLHFLDTMAQISSGRLLENSVTRAGTNTTIGVVATNATLTKTQMTKVAQMAHDGLSRSINPVHTPADGDTIFAAATGGIPLRADVTTVGALAAQAMAQAVRRAVRSATSIPGFVAHRDLPQALRGQH